MLMFGFAFALVPIYDVFCKVTGLNGKVDISKGSNLSQFTRYKTEGNASNRFITVEFDVNRNGHLSKNLICEFNPQHTVLQVKPGELTHTAYYIKNLTKKTLIVQAIPSISPGLAAKHLKKLECFCFNKQVLKPNEGAYFPLRFWLEPEIPQNITRLTLSYTLFDVTHPIKAENNQEKHYANS